MEEARPAANMLGFGRLRVAVLFQSLASGLVLLWGGARGKAASCAGKPADLNLRPPAESTAKSGVPTSSRYLSSSVRVRSIGKLGAR
jgi:hypothetical protein